AAAPDEVLERAHEMARDIATNVAPVSAAIVKRNVQRFLEATNRKQVERLEGRLFAWTAKQDDAREGPTAFLEKREPRWKLGKNSSDPDDVYAGWPSPSRQRSSSPGQPSSCPAPTPRQNVG